MVYTHLQAKRTRPEVQRHTLAIPANNVATIYGCCGIFDLCGDSDLISLSRQGASPFLDWIGWVGTEQCIIEKDFYAYSQPAEGGTRTGWLADPCDDPNTVEWKTCSFRYEDFARLRRGGPTDDVTKQHIKLCERQPQYRLDGTPVTSDKEFRAVMIMDVIQQDIHSLAIIGNQATAGQFDGLQQIVATGYTDYKGNRCKLMDSIVINWNHNPLSGGAGATWTDGRGVRALLPTHSFVDVLHSAYRKVRQRIKWSPTLASQRMQVGDMIFVGTTDFLECLLDQYTCWRVCPGGQYSETNLNSLEARTFRNTLLGGLFGDGVITLDGFEIPLLSYDWELQTGPTSSDAYLLVGAVGNIKTLMGEYNNMTQVPMNAEGKGFFVSDGGRFLHWLESDHTCVEQVLEFQPRIIAWAPWTLVRFQNLVCHTPGGHLGPDPLDTSYFPDSSLSVAVC